MNLDEKQKKTVSTWISEGLKLSDIQKRLDSELGIRLTYMEVRFLVDDLKLVPKDVERPKPTPDLGAPASGPGPAAQPAPAKSPAPSAAPQHAPLTPEEQAALTGGGSISVSVDQITRAGAVVSGQVTFSDGQSASWYLDQYGRLGMAPKQQGYKPSAADLQSFQMKLESELARMGF